MIVPDLSRRADIPELMDSGSVEETELESALDFLERVDRFLGGRRLVFRQLGSWLRGWPSGAPVTVLDVGTGGAHFPAALQAWGRARGLRVSAVGLDPDPKIARLARRRVAGAGVEIIEQTVESFALSGRRFDFVTASLMLHHVPDDGLVCALRALDALSERGVLISDLRRCALGYWGARALTSAAGGRLSRHDGPASVLRAFTPAELRDLASRAGLGYLRARIHASFRLTLSGLKTDG